MKRFFYEPHRKFVAMGFEVFDRRRGHTEPMAQVPDVHDAERIVEALNQTYGEHDG